MHPLTPLHTLRFKFQNLHPGTTQQLEYDFETPPAGPLAHKSSCPRCHGFLYAQTILALYKRLNSYIGTSLVLVFGAQ